ncbi:DciA family protein [Arthrobacter sp. ATA002]|nr:DciA family protein [Arthrobacter sp. ATA002]WAP53267.1 DciA family protein [Arthrobacter sp. ATA002]
MPPARTGNQGADEPEARQDAAQAQLNRMRQAAQARGSQRIPASRRKAGHRRAALPFVPGEYTGRDPQGVGKVFNRFVSERGWNSPVAVGSVISRWEELVGADVSAHCKPESFSDTTVQVRCDSTAWATQLRLLRSSLISRFDAELGPGVVTKIEVIGPAAPNWRKGQRSVKGRGPRDTYG